MNKILQIFLLLLFFFSSICYGQRINGIVKDADSEDILIGANVFLKDTNIGSVTNIDGSFSFEFPLNGNSEETLIVSYLGYHNYEIKINSSQEAKVELIVPLKKSHLNLDQIVVTGTKTERFLKDTPVSTRVISREQLETSGASDIKQVLSEINGVVIHENQFGTGVNTVEIQGFSSQHVQILVDGIKMIGRVNGELDISEIPLTQVERIEIVKGAASALYGSEAMGGVINIITKKEEDNLSFSSDVVSGSYGRFDGSLGVNVPVGIWKSSLNLSYRKYGGYDLNEDSPSEDGTAYNKYHGQLSIVGKFSENLQLNIKSLYVDEEHTVQSSSIFEDHISNNHYAGRIQLSSKNLINMLNIKSGIEYSEYEHKYDQKVLSSGYYKKGSVTNEKLIRGDVLFDYSLRKHKVNGGYSLEYEAINSDRVLGTEQNSTLHNVFLQDEFNLNNWSTVLGGIRLDAHSVYGSQFSPKIALMIKSTNTSRIRLSYAEGFRSPSFKELFIEYINLTVGYHIKGNPDLQPEKSKSLQTDFEYWNNNNYHVRFHFFYNYIRNLIDYEYLGVVGEYGTYGTQNLTKVNTWGGDFEVEYFPFDFLNCKLGYSYFNSWDSETDNPLSLKSKHKINFSISVNFIESLAFNFRGQYFGEQYYWSAWDDLTQTGIKDKIQAYLLLHTNLNYKIWDSVALNTGVRNLTDYVNKTWGPMPGREWYAGIRYNYN